VYVKGVVVANSALYWEFPVGYRPSILTFIMHAYDSGGSWVQTGRLSIDTNGVQTNMNTGNLTSFDYYFSTDWNA
jgi:hypothetical protein